MDKIIYGVYKIVGESEDRDKFILKCFPTIKAANAYRDYRENEEKIDRKNSKRCRDCGGFNKECPLWVEPFDNSGECAEYYNRAFRWNATFIIEEIPYEEED